MKIINEIHPYQGQFDYELNQSHSKNYVIGLSYNQETGRIPIT